LTSELAVIEELEARLETMQKYSPPTHLPQSISNNLGWKMGTRTRIRKFSLHFNRTELGYVV